MKSPAVSVDDSPLDEPAGEPMDDCAWHDVQSVNAAMNGKTFFMDFLLITRSDEMTMGGSVRDPERLVLASGVADPEFKFTDTFYAAPHRIAGLHCTDTGRRAAENQIARF